MIKVEKLSYAFPEKDLYNKWSDAKANKDFALADQIRDDLLSKGIQIVDTREGTTYKMVN